MNKKSKNKKALTRSFLQPANRISQANSLTRNSSIFPKYFRTKLITTWESSISATATTDFMFKGNSMYQIGPNTSWTAPSFSVNVPSGLVSLLSSPTPAGAVAPYSRYRIYHSRVRFEFTPTTISSTIPYNVAVFPSNNIDYTGMALATVNEQPYDKSKFYSSTNVSGAAPKIVNDQTTMSQFGLRYKSQMEDVQYSGSATADPANVWYWHVRFDGISATAISLYIKVRIEYDIEFFNLNSLSSAAPTFVSSPSLTSTLATMGVRTNGTPRPASLPSSSSTVVTPAVDDWQKV